MDQTASDTGSACSRGSGSDSGDNHASVAEQAQKRRLVIIAAAVAAVVCVVSRHISKRQKKTAVRMARQRVQKNVFDWARHMGEITDFDFRRMYRLSWDAFKELLALLKPKLEPIDQTRASNAKYGERVLPEMKLAITLRYLAGSSIHDLRAVFKTSISTMYDYVWATVSAINSHPELQVSFPLPNKVPGKDADADEYNKEQLRRLVELEAEFRSNSRTPKANECWHGQVLPPCAIIIVHNPAARCGYTHTSVLPRVSVSGGRARWRCLRDEEAPLQGQAGQHREPERLLHPPQGQVRPPLHRYLRLQEAFHVVGHVARGQHARLDGMACDALGQCHQRGRAPAPLLHQRGLGLFRRPEYDGALLVPQTWLG
jgi:hypothetical protein